MSSKSTIATELSEDGFIVFPLVPNKKEPYAIKYNEWGGKLHQYAYGNRGTQWIEPNVLNEFFNDYPNSNIAVLTGRYNFPNQTLSGLTVIDCDDHGKSNGYKWFLDNVDFDPWEECIRIIKTPRGMHFYFNYSDKFPNGTKHFKEVGIDIINSNSYVLYPPSITEHGKYEFEHSGRNNNPIPEDSKIYEKLEKAENRKLFKSIPVEDKTLRLLDGTGKFMT